MKQQVEVEFAVDIEIPATSSQWTSGTWLYIDVEIVTEDASFDHAFGTEPREAHNITIIGGTLMITDNDGDEVGECLLPPREILKHLKFDDIATEAYRAAGLY